MSATIQITLEPGAGLFSLIHSFENIDAAVIPAIRAVVQQSALNIEGTAKKRIQTGPKTGRQYGKHRASAPGQSPASDTGRLAGSVHQHMIREMAAVITADASYAAYLELGTVKMAPRPYLLPALQQEEPTFINHIEAALEGAFDI